MKKSNVFRGIRKLMLAGLSVMLLSTYSINSNAQCSVSSINIGTGYDYANSSALAVGANDPEWEITYISADLSAGMPTTPPTPPYDAIVTTQHVGSWVTSTPNMWISLATNNFCNTVTTGTYEMVLERSFTVCKEDDIEIILNGARDNYVNIVLNDGISTTTLFTSAMTSPAPIANFNTLSNLNTLGGVHHLLPGTYTLEVTVIDEAVLLSQNAIGFFLDGTSVIQSTTGTNSILDNGCEECDPEFDCSDECYWKVEGNNILYGRNKFGTTSDDDVEVITNNIDRGIIKNGNSTTGGYLGWNTMNPTARLHVDCINGNEDGSGTSDIRFENLEHGEGWILVIDDEGYVYRTDIHINDVATGVADGGDAMQASTEEQYVKDLEARIQALEAKLNALTNSTTSTDVLSPENDNSKLYQNSPNPFGRETAIEFYVNKMERNAYIAVYDLSGKELNRHEVRETGKGKVIIDGHNLQPGMYVYSLIIDGREADSKRMVLSK